MKVNLTKRQRIFAFVAVVITVAAVFAGLLLLDRRSADGEDPGGNSIYQTIPEADLQETDSSKTGSYRHGGSGEYNSLPEEEAAPGQPQPADGYSPEEPRRGSRHHPGTVAVNDLFGEYQGGPDTPTEPKRRSGGGGASRPRQAAETPAPQEPASATADETDSETEPPRPVKRSGAISSLDQDVATDLGNGFSTLDGTDMWVSGEEGKPYRCMFIRDEKVRSGQRITVRLLEDLVAGGVHIPKNTHLQGVCTISDRMEVAVTSLDMGGRIISLSFQAYDTDGGKGIYCSDLSQVRQEVTEQGMATVTSGLNSRLGRVARDAASVGASIVRNKAGEATVSVPAGYTFYIMEERL